MSQAGELAHFIVAKTTLHPAFQDATHSQVAPFKSDSSDSSSSSSSSSHP